ncbi:MAG: tetratricopeptide repeat protein [Elusimicrobiota bacterium]
MAEIKFSKHHEIKEDRFIEWLAEAKKKILEKQKKIWTVFVIILVIAALVFFFRWDKKQKNYLADKLFGKVMVLFQDGKTQEGVDTLQKIYKDFPGTHAASKSLFILANLEYHNNNYENAIKFYEIYEREYGRGDFFHAAAVKGIGACYEQKKEYDKALKYYERIRKDFKDDFSIPEILLKMARCYKATDKMEKSKTMCEELISKYEKSEYADQAKLLLNSL